VGGMSLAAMSDSGYTRLTDHTDTDSDSYGLHGHLQHSAYSPPLDPAIVGSDHAESPVASTITQDTHFVATGLLARSLAPRHANRAVKKGR
jgi:hypothetical protein